MPLSNRIKTHTHISTELACYSDVRLSDLLHKAKPMHFGIGGNSALLTIDDSCIFVKKIPLTDLEREPKHIMSTANLFELPLFQQYGIGLAGSFGAWRELVAHVMTTNWVLSGECPNFPLMYHWRVLQTSKSEPMDSKELEDFESAVQYLDDSAAVRKRFEAVQNASAYIVLFLEYVPETLYQWLGTQLKTGGATAEQAIFAVEDNLKTTTEFMNSRGFSHFDAHFKNILTDGKLVYFSDFGLALSSKFELTPAESDFLNMHRTYDRCVNLVNLVYTVIASLFGEDRWQLRLREYLNGEKGEIDPALATTIKQYAPIALLFMDEFYGKLQKEAKSTPYPAIHVERLLKAIDDDKRVEAAQLSRQSL
jgi:hypothetical protein